jgi:hypothetical protein
MALRSTYSEANKQIIELPTTTKIGTVVIMYTVTGGTEGNYTFGNAPFLYVESITRESYSYVGMTAAAAATCAEALIATYTKNVSVPIINASTGAVTYENKSLIVASVRARHTGCGMFQVDVERNEPEYTLVALFTLPS